MKIYAKSWVGIFLFYGAVCFGLGLLGFWMKHGEWGAFHRPAPVKYSEGKHMRYPNLMNESEQFVHRLWTGLNGAVSQGRNEESTEHLWKADEAVPVISRPTLPVWFCFPDTGDAGNLGEVIVRIRSNLKAAFPNVKDVPIAGTDSWQRKLGFILNNQDNTGILFGMNAGNGIFKLEPVTMIHLYLGIPVRWGRTFINQLTAEVFNSFDAVNLGKQRIGTREIFELEWPEPSTDDGNNLEQKVNLIIRILAQFQAMQVE